ncbi:JAB domain-containing protein [Azotobacter vinelandii]|uniref:JAB domain-containing protein n=1 Tax=Azotobacter vinelandii TaxID=354 RepID=UPI00091251E0|nr:JAB domain-containing protein [Azotobacter vinelandii]WKN23177.1 DNA repair protein RadC [Azotobacter vinelandii]SFY09266.1 DNA repair protein RadC [Azotobacter vinelandii]
MNMELMVRDAQGRYLVATAEQILEAARQVIDWKVPRGTLLTSTSLARDYLRTKLGGYEREVFAAAFLTSEHRLIEYVEMFRGTINAATVYPREVVKTALQLNAAAVIFAHNHPSGDLKPSGADRELTKTLKQSLALVDILVLDHIIVAGDRTMSFADSGIL